MSWYPVWYESFKSTSPEHLLSITFKAAVDIFQLLFVLDDQFVTASMIGNFCFADYWLVPNCKKQQMRISNGCVALSVRLPLEIMATNAFKSYSETKTSINQNLIQLFLRPMKSSGFVYQPSFQKITPHVWWQFIAISRGLHCWPKFAFNIDN